MKLKHLCLLTAVTSIISIPVSYAATSNSPDQAKLHRCADPVFYAQTSDHDKEVEVCIIQSEVSYSFGQTVSGVTQQKNIVVPKRNTSFISQGDKKHSLNAFTVYNENTAYQVAYGTNDTGAPFATLDIYNNASGDKHAISHINFDPDTVIGNISYELSGQGIPAEKP
ncbi:MULTISPECIES: hypothetical protein [unclassified Tatumella]|uniref:hypothetical protein n=1 Tax=unclassified Tatumella TaxID=2649542 RepID=UPI001BAF7594|nr:MULTISPECIES: hypothetical protein [unclassified Tatumella]MBS0856063.1 hypothetical protein [Tatumella sp. JGM16]MBS0878122.1 hypothetical protein [Tatumella sp. JGM82]MBS0890481.1 hypothetical protein [Tatumella sp. JGM94]MBS0900937.1 hypothetical protein [Tatumella sp. JGM100]MBS0913042.1 hypothetical protein [Tatumella sp. JGM91]